MIFNDESPKKLVSFFRRMIVLTRLVGPIQRLFTAKTGS
jgi:hypothetical protein